MHTIRRFRNPYMPIARPGIGERMMIAMERLIKGPIYKCSMCGNCILQETAYVCPILCPKGLRNGPCGSGSSEYCCVDPDRPCAWHLIYQRAETAGTLERLLEVQAPLDWSNVGRSTWGDVVKGARSRNLLSPFKILRDPQWGEGISSLFRDLRQPQWWSGDDEYHPPELVDPVSSLQTALNNGEFVVTTEIVPPAGANTDKLAEKAGCIKSLVHAVNIATNPMATARMSSLACCRLLVDMGIEPILQITGRDYNRLNLQSDMLGASALGIRNVLCLTGDTPTAGKVPFQGLPFDLDATQLLWIFRRLRDEERFLDGRKLVEPPDLFLGAAGSPNDPNPTHEALRIAKKINAGAQFIQTQLVYDPSNLERWLEALDARNLLSKVHILVGLAPLRSLEHATFLEENIPDVTVPPHLITRLERSSCPEEVGVEITQELIHQIKLLPGVSGIHLMSVGRNDSLLQILEEATSDLWAKR